MPYTVWSKGRKLGETELGLVRIMPDARMGWFVPVAEFDGLMLIATGEQLALYADASPADLAAAHQHRESLELELRREDGSVVPTAGIGIRDMEALLAWDARKHAADPPEYWDDADDPLLGWDEQDDSELLDDFLTESEFDLVGESGDARSEDVTLPRYQIHVELIDPGDIL
jgi:hypothetical protein